MLLTLMIVYVTPAGRYSVEFMKNIHTLAVDDHIPDIQFKENGARYQNTDRRSQGRCATMQMC